MNTYRFTYRQQFKNKIRSWFMKKLGRDLEIEIQTDKNGLIKVYIDGVWVIEEKSAK